LGGGVDLPDLVSGIFAFQGFAVVQVTRGAAGAPSGIIVRRGPLEIAIAVVPGAVPMDEGRVEALEAELAERPGARHLIVHAGTVTDGARAAAAVRGTVLWDRERLIAESGSSLVALADPDPFHPSGGGAPLEETARTAFARGGRVAIHGAWPSAQAPRSQPRPPAGRRRTLAPARGGDGEAVLGALPVRADEERARQLAAASGGGVLRADLEWVPAYLLDYHVVAEVQGPRETQTVLASGTLLVSAAGGEAEEVDGPIEIVPPRQVLDKATLTRALARRRLSLIEAREKARQEALARTERTEQDAAASGPGATVTETRRRRPRGPEVDLLARGLVVLPYFLVETERGLVTVNAGTGRVVRVAPFSGDRAPGAGGLR
jgi:hypothetical protein